MSLLNRDIQLVKPQPSIRANGWGVFHWSWFSRRRWRNRRRVTIGERDSARQLLLQLLMHIGRLMCDWCLSMPSKQRKSPGLCTRNYFVSASDSNRTVNSLSNSGLQDAHMLCLYMKCDKLALQLPKSFHLN